MPEYQVGMYVEWNKQIWEIMGIGTATPEHPAPMQLRDVVTNEPKSVTWSVPVPCCPRCRGQSFDMIQGPDAIYPNPAYECGDCGLPIIDHEGKWITQSDSHLKEWSKSRYGV